MNKLNPLNIQTPDYIDEKKLDYVYKVKNHSLTKDFIEKEGINDAIILKHLSKFLKVIEQNEECLNCKTFKDCAKKSKGLQLSLKLEDDGIDLSFSPCSKYREFYQLNYSYLYRSFNESFLLHNFEELILNKDYATIRKQVLGELMNIKKTNLSKGVYLYGDHGTGKTFIMSLFSK